MDDQEIELTPAQQVMAQAHEMFLSARYVGFTHGEALYLVATMVCGGPKLPAEGDE
jgi:hypothetical protein